MSESQAPVAPSRSLLVRTTAALGLALVVMLGALVLVLQPFLAGAFEKETTHLLRDDEARARGVARLADETTESVIRTAVAKTQQQAADAARDAPLELVAGDADAARALLDECLRRAFAGSEERLAALGAQMRARSEERLADLARASESTSVRQARVFAGDIGWRAASVLLALLAVLFLVHGALLWRTVIAPVARLSEATREVAQGRLATRLPVRGDDEVARLAASFNTMTQSLERAQGELVALNATLEDRVREKSAALVRAERELRHAEKMASLGTLAGGVAHEFGNLLGGIQGCAEDALRETDPAEVRETLGVIERTARRGSSITDKLLRFARPAPAGHDEVDVAAVARDVASLVEPEAARCGVEVEVEAPGEVRLVADPTGVHQVVLNLVTNALHAMPGGGKLTVAVAGGPGDVRLCVTDTGVGIPPGDRAKLFEPFFTTRPEGTGLGLSVSYGIVKAHGGRIDVESEPGRGSTFTVVLPLSPREGVAP
jgi:signal transduction histidine kinase